MSKEIASFQENIRKTFILFSVTPVIVTVFGAIIIFVFTWGTYLSATNRRDCQVIADETTHHRDVDILLRKGDSCFVL